MRIQRQAESFPRTAAWQRNDEIDDPKPVSVRHAGFASYVGDDRAVHDALHPDPHDHYTVPAPQSENMPDSVDNELRRFIPQTGNPQLWKQHEPQPQDIDLTQPIHATQSHVSQYHVDRYKANPQTHTWDSELGVADPTYLAEKHPMFVTHHNKLHCVEGHHRVAAALQSGATSIQGWHYNLDKHPFVRKPYRDEDDE